MTSSIGDPTKAHNETGHQSTIWARVQYVNGTPASCISIMFMQMLFQQFLTFLNMIVPAFQVQWHRSLLGLDPQLTPALASESPSLRPWHQKLQCPRHLGVSSCNRNNFINSKVFCLKVITYLCSMLPTANHELSSEISFHFIAPRYHLSHLNGGWSAVMAWDTTRCWADYC